MVLPDRGSSCLGCLLMPVVLGLLGFGCFSCAGLLIDKKPGPGDQKPALVAEKKDAPAPPADPPKADPPAPTPVRPPAPPPPPAVAVAPAPRPIPLVRPPAGRSTPWVQVGQVRARVLAVAHTPAPLVTAKGAQVLGEQSCALVWLEFENLGPAPRTVRRYQPSPECVLTTPTRAPVPGELFGTRSLDDHTPYNQLLSPGGPPAVNVLAFLAADVPAGDHTLTLDAIRVGEIGRFVFVIPAAAWRR